MISGDENTSLLGILIQRSNAAEPHTVIVYLQGMPASHSAKRRSRVSPGNAGNPLGRIPVFERLLLENRFDSGYSKRLSNSAILAVAPRSYWKSSRRTPTEADIISDYTHVVTYAARQFPDAKIVLYGHSLGGAAAVCLSAWLKAEDFPMVQGMILENPFRSIPGMVEALYPQRWLPYHYLGRFAFDKWDTLRAVRIASTESLLGRLAERTLVILSEKDELVPNEMGEAILRALRARQQSPHPDELSRQVVVIPSALHETAWMDRRWRRAIGDYVDWLYQLPNVQIPSI